MIQIVRVSEASETDLDDRQDLLGLTDEEVITLKLTENVSNFNPKTALKITPKTKLDVTIDASGEQEQQQSGEV